MIDQLAPQINIVIGQTSMVAASSVLLNSRFGCFLAIGHAFSQAVFNNMYNLRPYMLQYINYKYKDGTPINKKPSPCLPYKEFDEKELLIDKSTSFNETFLKN